jgi:hypothetical protein
VDIVMPLIKTRLIRLNDVAQVRRLSRRINGDAPGKRAILAAATQYGNLGYAAGMSEEALTGFMLGTVEPPVVRISWLVVEPRYREQTLASMIRTLTIAHPNLTYTFRVPHEDYELLAALRDELAPSTLKPVDADASHYRHFST